jgi:hypothetical protein
VSDLPTSFNSHICGISVIRGSKLIIETGSRNERVDDTGRLVREGKALISAELAGMFERLDCSAPSWQIVFGESSSSCQSMLEWPPAPYTRELPP